MKNVLLKIAVWTNDKYSPLFTDSMNLETRMKFLQEAVRKARKWLDAEDHTGLETLKIFIAPENLLMDSRPVGSVGNACAVSFKDFQAYCQEEKLDQMCTGVLPDLSHGILLIPGTVLLKKPLKSPTAFKLDRHESRLRSCFAKQFTEGTEPFKTAVNQNMGRLKRKIEHIDEKVKVSGLHENELDVQLVRNIALVFFDRQLVFKYKKQREYKVDKQPTDEFNKADKVEHTAIKFFPGYKEGVFHLNVGGASISCGIEICMDHNTGQLRYTEGEKVHLQFIVSDRVTNKPENAVVKDGGYIIHASTDKDASGVFDHEFKSTERSAPLKLIKSGRGMLMYHQHILKLASS